MKVIRGIRRGERVGWPLHPIVCPRERLLGIEGQMPGGGWYLILAARRRPRVPS